MDREERRGEALLILLESGLSPKGQVALLEGGKIPTIPCLAPGHAVDFWKMVFSVYCILIRLLLCSRLAGNEEKLTIPLRNVNEGKCGWEM